MKVTCLHKSSYHLYRFSYNIIHKQNSYWQLYVEKNKIINKYTKNVFINWEGTTVLRTVKKQDVYNKSINAIFLYTFTYKC